MVENTGRMFQDGYKKVKQENACSKLEIKTLDLCVEYFDERVQIKQ